MASRKKKKEKKRQKPAGRSGGREAVPDRRKLPNWPVLAFALAGTVLTAYLTASSWFGVEPAYCGEGSTCDVVQSSRWGTFLGAPTAFWGLVTYLAIAYVAWRERKPARHWKIIWVLSLAGLGYSIYLTIISVGVIGATCVYCLLSLALLAAIFVIAALQKPAVLPEFSWPSWVVQTTLLALIIAGGMHAHYSGVFDSAAGAEDPYLKGLAEHLVQSGVVFYGAYW